MEDNENRQKDQFKKTIFFKFIFYMFTDLVKYLYTN